jgi:hypothetical protein
MLKITKEATDILQLIMNLSSTSSGQISYCPSSLSVTLLDRITLLNLKQLTNEFIHLLFPLLNLEQSQISTLTNEKMNCILENIKLVLYKQLSQTYSNEQKSFLSGILLWDRPFEDCFPFLILVLHKLSETSLLWKTAEKRVFLQ